MRRRPMQAWVSCSGGRTTACDPHALGGRRSFKSKNGISEDHSKANVPQRAARPPSGRGGSATRQSAKPSTGSPASLVFFLVIQL